MDVETNNVATAPHHILGYTIHSRTRIYVSYLTPAVLELFVYICQIVADIAVSYQHFHSHQADFGWATLCLILVPPVLTFVFIVSSKDHRDDPCNANKKKFISYQLAKMILFPFVAIYRFSVRVFWSIEALFHDDNDKERMLCLEKTEECSTCELYHLIQAYGQSAPQIILQLFHMLTQDLWRNYQTTNAQAISLVFSAIDLAAITTTFQRFESQHEVGRHYPWSPSHRIEAQRQVLEKNERLRCECQRRQRDSERTISSFPESEKIMANFNLRNSNEPTPTTPSSDLKTHSLNVEGIDEVDNEAIEETKALLHTNPKELTKNITDDDKIRSKPSALRLPSIREEMKNLNAIEIETLEDDGVPNTPAPLPPIKRAASPVLSTQLSTGNSETTSANNHNKRSSKTITQLDTFKDMLIVNAQLYIKEHVPRPPKLLTSRIELPSESTPPMSPTSPVPPQSPQDVVDFFLPRPTKVIDGIEQDDFAGKTIAFFGWISFVIMRMLSLATFSVFFPKAFFIILSIHYALMLLMLICESRFQGKLNRTLFYLLLAYVYIFVILEFRIKFKRIRLWYIGYFIITMAENIGMTMMWYAREEFESWWFGFIFEGIIYSGILFVATIIVYYCILKPRNVTLIVDDEKPNNDNNNQANNSSN